MHFLKEGQKIRAWVDPPPLIRAMPERKRFFFIDVFPISETYVGAQWSIILTLWPPCNWHPPMITRFASCVFVENTMPWYGTEKVQLFNDFISLLPLETQVGAILRGIHSSDLGH